MPLCVARRRGLHGLPAAAHELQPGLEVDRTGEDQRRVLAQAQSPAAPWHAATTSGLVAFRPSSAARLATKIAGWLTSVAFRASAGPVEAERAPGRCRGCRPARSNSAAPPAARESSSRPMPTDLSALAGEQEGDLGHRGPFKPWPRARRSRRSQPSHRRCPAAAQPASCSTIKAARRSSAIVPATRRAFLIARLPELPWQMMQAPRMPRSGPPPNSSYSNRDLSLLRLAAILRPGVAGQLGHQPGQLLLEGREQELDGPFPGLEQDVADEPVADRRRGRVPRRCRGPRRCRRTGRPMRSPETTRGSPWSARSPSRPRRRRSAGRCAGLVTPRIVSA